MRPPLLFRALMWLYPPTFRAEFGEEMSHVFAMRWREAQGPLAPLMLWLPMIIDIVITSAQCHFDLLKQDLGYAVRSLRRTPGFTATVLVVAALGIGANAAAFSITDYVLLRPLPFKDASRLVVLWQTQQGRGANLLSPANYRDWKSASTSFEGMDASWNISANLVGQGEPQRLEGAAVTANLFPLLGVAPMLGRGFNAEDDREGAPGTVLLSSALWRGSFGGEASALGRSITLDGESYVIIGVMPPTFAYPSRETQFWKPIRFRTGAFDERGDTHLSVVARLKSGVSIPQAQAELDVISENLERAYPEENADIRCSVNAMRAQISQQSRLLVLALTGAAACVLLIACLNLANLLLARALTRRKELALRAALGAGRERLVRQLLTESLLLSVAGGVLGVLLAIGALPLLARLVPPTLPIAAVPSMDLRVLVVTATVAILSGVAFGVLPSWRVCRTVDAEGLKEDGRSSAGRRQSRLVRAIVVAEVSISLVLLVAAGLLLRTLQRVQELDPGFSAQGVLTLRTWLPWPKYEKTAERVQFYDRVLLEARALPAVTDAAYVSFLPMAMGGGIWQVAIPGKPTQASERRPASLRFVTPNYFKTMRIPLHAGRDVSDADHNGAEHVAVVSEGFAKRYFPDENPVGKRFTFAFVERTVVGVVGDVRVRGLEQQSEPQVYLPYQQVRDGNLIFYPPKDLVVRTSGDAMALVPDLRAIVRRADPEQPISNVRLLEEIVDTQTAPRRVQLTVIACFAALAFLLAGVGIYGLLSFAVSNRSQEFGVRMALGATPGSILKNVLRDGMILAIAGMSLGIVLAYLAARSMQALLVGVSAHDAATLLGGLGLVFLMTIIGSAIPAWRASRVDPTTAMRAE